MPLIFRHDVLLAARLELGLTQEDTARTLGIDVRTYRRYEAGTVNDPVKGFSVRRAGRRQLLGRFGQELGIAAEDLVQPHEGEVSADVSEPGRRDVETSAGPRVHHAHVLQPARHFVGREPELARLRRWESTPDAAPRITAIVAIGGTGKSALTQAWLDELTDEPGRGLLVWSFYEDCRAEAFVAAAVRALDGRLPPSAPLEALERLLAVVGEDSPHLLVLDGFEVMQSDGSARPRGSINDPYLRRLLSTIAARPGGTRVLLTSRVPLVDLQAWEGPGVQTLRLGPLEASDQRRLLKRWGVRGTAAQARLALERYGGHALSVATFASYVVGFHGGTLAQLGEIELGEAARDDLLAFRLERLVDAYARAMTESQRDLVARMSVFVRGADVDALLALAREGEALAGAMPRDRRSLVRALSRLEAMGVVYRSRETSSVFSTHPLLADAFRDRLGAIAIEIQEVLRRLAWARVLERSASDRSAQLERLEDLLVHSLRAGRVPAAVGIYGGELGGFGHLGLERGDMARGLRILRAFFVDGDPERFVEGLEARQHSWLLYELALYASSMGDPEYARLCLDRYVRLVEGSAREHTTGWRTTAYVLRLEGHLDRALHAVDRALEIGKDHPDHVARNLGLRGAILHDRGQWDEAADCFARATAIEPGHRYRRLLWEAEHLVDRGRLDEAAALARHGRQACLDLRWGGHISHCDVVLGHCEAGHDPERAAERLAEARRWAYASGEVEAQLRCVELEARLAPDDQRRHRAVDRARTLIEASGFERFAARLLVNHGHANERPG